jgi:hypothetical protein
MQHDIVQIAMQAKNLVEQYGEGAIYYAEEKFFELMQTEDISQATVWLSILNELRKMINYNSNN